MNTRRRNLLKMGVACAVTSKLLRARGATPARRRLGLQLYTISDELHRDFKRALQEVAAIGYTEIEFAGFLGKSPAAWRDELKATGLRAVSGHFLGPQLQSSLDSCIDYARELGLQYMVCPAPTLPDAARLEILSSFPADSGKPAGGAVQQAFERFTNSFTLEDWQWNADFFNKVGQRVKEAGMQFAYHNHNVEFRRFGERTAYDELLARTEPAVVTMELDCGWLTQAGGDPAAVLAAHPRRFRLLHVKDVKRGFVPGIRPNPQPADVGSGAVEWKRVFAAAERVGVQHYFLEQEPPFPVSPLASIRKGFEYLQGV